MCMGCHKVKSFIIFEHALYEKMPVFEILECRLYQEKNGIYACQNVVEACSKHGDMILCYLL